MKTISLEFNQPLKEKISSSVLSEFQKNIDKKKFCFLQLLNQDLSPLKNFSKQQKNKFNDIVILGIGGSALGGKSIIRALKKPYWNTLNLSKRQNIPRIFFLDTTDPEQILSLEKEINLKKTLFLCISKCGETTEPLSLFIYFLKKIKHLFPQSYQNNFLIITEDNKKNPLKKIAAQEKIISFAVPRNLSGRFSVLSPVGLLPAALTGIDIDQVIKGAKNILLQEATSLAAWQYHFDQQKKKNITVIFPYSYRLEKFANWYIQLLAESIGKNKKGPTPLKATGPRDQHSLVQLFTEGPDDKIYLFLKVENSKETLRIPVSNVPSPLKYLKNITFNQLIHSQLQSTFDALTKKKRPCVILTLPEINEYYFGQLLMLFELQVALLGDLYQVNAFNQPGVELGKKLIKKKLKINI